MSQLEKSHSQSHIYILPPIFTDSHSHRQKSHESRTVNKMHQLSGMISKPVTSRNKYAINKHYLKSVSTGLEFSRDVVRERCSHLLPYASDLDSLLKYDHLITRPCKFLKDTGRHNNRLMKVKHLPCHLKRKIRIPPIEKPLKVKQDCKPVVFKENAILSIKDSDEKAIALLQLDKADRSTENFNKDAVKSDSIATVKDYDKRDNGDNSSPGATFITEGEFQSKTCSKTQTGGRHALSRYQWESYMLSLLGPRMCNWIIQKCADPEQRELLTELMQDWHGQQEGTDLLREDDIVNLGNIDTDMNKTTKVKDKMWIKPEATLLEKIYGYVNVIPRATDPYSQNNDAPFYRQPISVRKMKKAENREIEGSINATANEIDVKTYVPAPPPNLSDFMNPNVGDKCYVTTCAFENETLTGVRQIHQPDATKIIMESNNRYRKQLRSVFPPQPTEWDHEPRPEVTDDNVLIERGMHRWSDVPEPIDDTSALNRFPQDLKFKVIDSQIKRIYNPSLTQIVDDWRSSWHLKTQFMDSSFDDLIHDMADIQGHVRLKAVSTVAQAGTYRIQSDPNLPDLNRQKEPLVISDKMYTALEHLLDDVDEKVRTAAAITLYTLGRPSQKANTILQNALDHGNSADKWAAVQCLAQHGAKDSGLIMEIIQSLMTTESAVRHERAASLLVKISRVSSLVYPLMAEQLNSRSWRHKVIACKVLPTLCGNINKDITNKLVSLMWTDWHTEVRNSAAQALGKTGNGRVVHDDLIKKIVTGNEGVRVEAISKIGHLGIMTGKLLPSFLDCLEDPYASVRTEACITCGNLRIKEPKVLEELLKLACHDHIWKVKAVAMQAIAKIGVALPEMKTHLVWAIRYESEPGVRVEACRSLSMLNLVNVEVANILQDQLLVEGNEYVRSEIIQALSDVGLSPSDDMNTVTQIKEEVYKLCQTDLITEQIRVNEAMSEEKEDRAKFIYSSGSQRKDPIRVHRSNGPNTVKTHGAKAAKKQEMECEQNGDSATEIYVDRECNILSQDECINEENVENESSRRQSLVTCSEKLETVRSVDCSTNQDISASQISREKKLMAGRTLLGDAHGNQGKWLGGDHLVDKEQVGDIKLTEGLVDLNDVMLAMSRSASANSCDATLICSRSKRLAAVNAETHTTVSRSSQLRGSELGSDTQDHEEDEKAWFEENRSIFKNDPCTNDSHPLKVTSSQKVTVPTSETASGKRVILSAKDLQEKGNLLGASEEIFTNLDRRYSQKLITVESQVGFLKMNRSEIMSTTGTSSVDDDQNGDEQSNTNPDSETFDSNSESIKSNHDTVIS